MNETVDYRPNPDDRLVEAMREYQAAIESGIPIARGEFLARYSDVANELSACLDGLSFVRHATKEMRDGDPAPAQEGVLGDFRLLREIGRGGMGVVYEAEQISLGRRVALKILPLAGTLDSRQMQRFEYEARAAAALHHSHVVPVFAVGRERGVPYYAMQLIEGRSLAEVIEEQREQGKPTTPGAETAANAVSITRKSAENKAFFRNVAELGVQAAEALDYAHQMGVVHRDVKPANLLLDDRNHLWVTDFGLARIQSAPGVTSPGDLIGTLRYMSPEQAAGLPVIDPRSDVYSLGATLYELLTNRPAFDAADRRECLRQVLEVEPTPPRRLDPGIPSELEIIVLKAMAKRPEERYAGARELADDLRRFLDDRPIEARRPGIQEHVVKWVRRHRRLVAGLFLALVGTVLILGATTWRISRAEAETRAALDQETLQRNRAEQSLLQARKVLDFITRIGMEEMDDKPEFHQVRKLLLTELLEYYKEFIDQNKDDAKLTDKLIETRYQVAGLLAELGRREESYRQFEQATYDRFRMPGAGPPPPMPRFRGPNRNMMRVFLLGNPEVRKELQLTPEQEQQLGAVIDVGRKPRSGETFITIEKNADTVLDEKQTERLKQISRQIRGIDALLDSAETLGLTEAQKDEIRSILNRQRRGGGGGGGPKHARWPGEPDRKNLDEQVLAVLTDQQRSKWRNMLGEEFKGDFHFFFGPPMHRPPPPHREH